MKETFIKALVEAVTSKKASIEYNDKLNKLTVSYIRKDEVREIVVNCTVDEYRQLTFLIAYTKEVKYHNLNL